jgi:hypothetical protein
LISAAIKEEENHLKKIDGTRMKRDGLKLCKRTLLDEKD